MTNQRQRQRIWQRHKFLIGLLMIIGLHGLQFSWALPITSPPLESTAQRLAWDEWVNMSQSERAQQKTRRIVPKSVFTLLFRDCPPGHVLHESLCIPLANIDERKLIAAELQALAGGNDSALDMIYDYSLETESSTVESTEDSTEQFKLNLFILDNLSDSANSNATAATSATKSTLANITTTTATSTPYTVAAATPATTSNQTAGVTLPTSSTNVSMSTTSLEALQVLSNATEATLTSSALNLPKPEAFIAGYAASDANATTTMTALNLQPVKDELESMSTATVEPIMQSSEEHISATSVATDVEGDDDDVLKLNFEQSNVAHDKSEQHELSDNDNLMLLNTIGDDHQHAVGIDQLAMDEQLNKLQAMAMVTPLTSDLTELKQVSSNGNNDEANEAHETMVAMEAMDLLEMSTTVWPWPYDTIGTAAQSGHRITANNLDDLAKQEVIEMTVTPEAEAEADDLLTTITPAATTAAATTLEIVQQTPKAITSSSPATTPSTSLSLPLPMSLSLSTEMVTEILPIFERIRTRITPIERPIDVEMKKSNEETTATVAAIATPTVTATTKRLEATVESTQKKKEIPEIEMATMPTMTAAPTPTPIPKSTTTAATATAMINMSAAAAAVAAAETATRIAVDKIAHDDDDVLGLGIGGQHRNSTEIENETRTEFGAGAGAGPEPEAEGESGIETGFGIRIGTGTVAGTEIEIESDRFSQENMKSIITTERVIPDEDFITTEMATTKTATTTTTTTMMTTTMKKPNKILTRVIKIKKTRLTTAQPDGMKTAATATATTIETASTSTPAPTLTTTTTEAVLESSSALTMLWQQRQRQLRENRERDVRRRGHWWQRSAISDNEDPGVKTGLDVDVDVGISESLESEYESAPLRRFLERIRAASLA